MGFVTLGKEGNLYLDQLNNGIFVAINLTNNKDYVIIHQVLNFK